MKITKKIPTRYTSSTDYDATTIVKGIPGITGWVWTVHTKHNVRAQGVEATSREAVAAAELAS